jgi:hypothetical protein
MASLSKHQNEIGDEIASDTEDETDESLWMRMLRWKPDSLIDTIIRRALMSPAYEPRHDQRSTLVTEGLTTNGRKRLLESAKD